MLENVIDKKNINNALDDFELNCQIFLIFSCIFNSVKGESLGGGDDPKGLEKGAGKPRSRASNVNEI